VREWLRRELDRGRIAFVRRFASPIAGDWVFRIDGRGTRTPQLEAFLAGKDTCGDDTMGALDFPPANIRFDRGQALFSGWTMSRHGVASIDLWFDNRTYKQPAKLTPDPLLELRCPGEKLTRTRYLVELPARPASVRRKTDVQVEVTDQRGRKTVFENRWFTWD
jgi:hypothetical protein